MDYRPAMIDALQTLKKRELAQKATFKARAYQTVLQQLEQLPGPIYSMADLQGIKGMGEKIREKIQEIFQTGHLQAAEKAKGLYALDAHDALQAIYGVGPAKAADLIQQGITTISELRDAVRENPALLNDKQRLGLHYYEDLLQRIPRQEMEEHERLLLAECPLPAELVGSYRRGASSSGDIDVLIRVPPHQTAKDTKSMFYYFVQRLVDKGYIKAILALGEHKCMAICSLDKDATARRLDLLITPDEEYPFALLYFTGSDRFNVAVRQRALERGYTLNEHRLTPILKESGEHRLTPLSAGQPLQTSTPSASREHRILALQAPRALQTPILKESGEHRLTPTLHTEEDILHFLGLEYVPPTERTDMTSLTEWTPPLRMRRPVMSPATSSSTSVSKA